MRDKKLRDVMIYLCFHYRHKEDLSKARLTKMVYLADWKYALDTGAPITDIKWHFDHYGPYVDKVVRLARKNDHFNVERRINERGAWKDLIQLKSEHPNVMLNLKRSEKKALNYVIKKTEPLYWNGFISLVYSTFPIAVSDRGTDMDLKELAEYYRKEIQPLDSSPLFDPLDGTLLLEPA